MSWLFENYEWVIGGILIPIIAALISKTWKKDKDSSNNAEHTFAQSQLLNNELGIMDNSNINNITINNMPINKPFDSYENYSTNNQIDLAKGKIKILFIDDDTKFKVVTILKKAGWIHTKSIKDIVNLDDNQVKETDIFFVDIHGVGKSLDFRDEGLGLSLALKKKYPAKKVVIYSSESKGDRFHEGLRNADSFLPKNAEPYEFQNLVEQFSIELLSSK